MRNTSPSSPAARQADGNDRLWSTSVGEDTAFLLARANAITLAAANAAVGGFGLKVRSYSVLALAVSGERPNQRELSEFLRLDPSQIVALIDELEKRGLVRREPDVNDRRVNVVVATDEGREVYAGARAATERAEAECFSALDDDDRDQLKAILRTLAAAPGASVG
ncbi:MarR family winged helix-turn-helix transcriptional regulator [Microbacterium immunditiarum]|uniref:DNA-binding MarR family transcriptional regulator n=1 Tax=Microbacterium immunditiarum TaxID=337480 RepID=A0A7Y9GKS4_9MICO|nr:MarR family winged helix-turn-helix transcriptional regulator [Microbacterium immunditiarum]NYE18267.1 DNA-binding MarR family transcriptional regulator [Microbacterium immunditiarum]